MATLKPGFWILLVGLLTACTQPGPSKWKVYFFVSTDCPLCQEYFPHIDSLMAALPADSFYAVAVLPAKFDPNATEDSLRKLLPNADEVLLDPNSEMSRKMKATVTPEVLLMKDDKLIYRGLIDNWPRSLNQKGIITEHYLNDALVAVRASALPPVRTTEPIGCIIEY